MLTRAIEHCDDTVMEHFDDKNSGAPVWFLSQTQFNSSQFLDPVWKKNVQKSLKAKTKAKTQAAEALRGTDSAPPEAEEAASSGLSRKAKSRNRRELIKEP